MTDRPRYNRALGVAGYDEDTGRWRDRTGRFTTEEEILRIPQFGGRMVQVTSRAPASELAERLELIIGGMDPRQLRAAEQMTDPMPAAILAMMRLCDFYCRTEGDVFQTIEVPLDIALKPLEFTSPDSGFQRELEILYDERHLDIHQWLYYAWLCSGIFGQSFLLELLQEPLEDSRIVMIPPKNIRVGRSFMIGGGLGILPPDGEAQWTKDLLEAAFPPMVYEKNVSDWNEAVANGRDIIIPPDKCFPIREKSLPFQRYAVPPITRASRALSTRRIFEEMRRATVEGHKNQLWLFLLGDAENRPLPEEVSFLADQVEGLYGERTGVLVWTGDLKVEVVAPQAPDTLMANDTYVGLTLEVFRKLGISLMMVSGERGPLGGSGRSGDLQLDLSVFLERLKFKVGQMYRWERQFRSKLAEQMGESAIKANEKTEVRFGKISVEVQQEIRERILPAYQAGPLSIQTFLQEGGWDWAVELQRKTEEERYQELFKPPASYAQMVVGQPGDGEKRVEQTTPGRPRDQQSPKPKREVQAGIYMEAVANFGSYVTSAYELFDALIGNRDVPAFIEGLKALNQERMFEFAKDGYLAAGGGMLGVTADALEDWTDGAVAFVNSYANNFGDRLGAVIDDPVALEDMRWNVYLYPQEGRHLAYMYGVQWAMREYGARGWRRVLHPELSKTGPCDDCINDSRIVHPIDEGFFEFHPNGVCTSQSVAFYPAPTAIPVEIPVPTKIFEKETILDYIRKILETLKRPVERVIRRVRRE